MNKPLLIIPGLFAAGIAAGAAVTVYVVQDRVAVNESQPGQPPRQSEDMIVHPMASAFTVSQQTDGERLQMLEQQIESLNQRIKQLEQQTPGVVAAGSGPAQALQGGANAHTPATRVDTPVSSRGPALTTANLVKAGIAEMLAEDIIRRKNEIDLQTLELRDRAVREGYINTSRYSDELDALLERDVSVRDEIGDDAYDRYLYASGQSNRVNIASVMHGSPAEQAGIQSGDIVLSYGDTQMFRWDELQDATTRGQRGEYVNVTVLRDGQQFNFWLPRGPLGVRLGSKRVEP